MLQARASTVPPDEDALAALVCDAAALVATAGDPITDRVLGAGSGLRIVAQFGVGVDNIDLEAARRRGIVVTNTPGAVTDSTADLAIALLLAVARTVPVLDRAVRRGAFSATGMGMELRGKVLGIIGLGHIGAARRPASDWFWHEGCVLQSKPRQPDVRTEIRLPPLATGGGACAKRRRFCPLCIKCGQLSHAG